jgi:hypothetical protein
MGFVNRMLNFIVRPPRPRGHYRHSLIEVESIVVERDTLATVADGQLSQKAPSAGSTRAGVRQVN